MSLPLTVSCFSKIQIGFTFLIPAHLGSPGKGPLNGCVCLYVHIRAYIWSINWNQAPPPTKIPGTSLFGVAAEWPLDLCGVVGTRRRSAVSRRACCTSTPPTHRTYSTWPTRRPAARSGSTYRPLQRRPPARFRPRWRSAAPRSKCQRWTWPADSALAAPSTSSANSQRMLTVTVT